jgi:hypothetical protein
MALIMEYIVVGVYVSVGFMIPPIRYGKEERRHDKGGRLGRRARLVRDRQGPAAAEA